MAKETAIGKYWKLLFNKKAVLAKMNNIQDTSNTPELHSPFEQLREVDADGKEWCNSRRLARVMGYGKYWNFESVVAKVYDKFRVIQDREIMSDFDKQLSLLFGDKK